MVACDFHGWATKANIKCSDGRTIMPNAFEHCNGRSVPLVWNHKHESMHDVLGHALLENRDEGVYAYCYFNDSENGQLAKVLVQHKDIDSLSIYANRLRQNGGNVLHGEICEVSLVHKGANPGAKITSVIAHSDDGEPIESEDECIIHTGERFSLYHADESSNKKEDTEMAEEKKTGDEKAGNEKTVKEVWDGIMEKMTEEEQNVIYAMIGEALGTDGADNDDEDDEEDVEMKHNVFDQDEVVQGGVLTHADQENIISLAKQSNVGSLKAAMEIFAKENGSLAHGLDLGDTEVLEELLPDHKLLNPGAPDILRAEQGWVMKVINKIAKSPYSRIRTRKADARVADLKAKGYKKGEEKKLTNHIKLLGRKTEPTTIYIKDEINRDDVVDITDFDVVNYIWNLMKDNMYETLALAALVGDGREDGDADKISETNIRPIWKDEELYTIHKDVDIAAAKTELQGSNTGANFGENYIYAEAIITAALYAREQFKGSGTPNLYCAPHLVNVMLLARDLNGRRIYDSKADLARALNVGEIVEIEQFEGLTRTTEEGDKKKLLGLFVNLADYQFGSTKGGEITKFDDFDIDFNKYKYLMETRLSGALTEPYSAIALEEPVTEAAG